MIILDLVNLALSTSANTATAHMRHTWTQIKWGPHRARWETKDNTTDRILLAIHLKVNLWLQGVRCPTWVLVE